MGAKFVAILRKKCETDHKITHGRIIVMEISKWSSTSCEINSRTSQLLPFYPEKKL